MARGIDWSRALDLELAAKNVETEFYGDWHQDPWGWPEFEFVVRRDPGLAYSHCDATGTLRPTLIDVPKENWGTRPAVVPAILDRLIYQALVDKLSVDLIGKMSPNAFGWRLPPTSPRPGHYARQNTQWEHYTGHLSMLASLYDVALVTDIASCFASISPSGVQEAIQDRTSRSAISLRLQDMVGSFAAVHGRTGLPQRSTASAILANMYLEPLDDQMFHYSKELKLPFLKKVKYRSFTRWMDDMWLFVDDASTAREAQIALQAVAHDLQLNLNSAKTDVLEGSDVALQAKSIEHSAVDAAIAKHKDLAPLEALIDRLLVRPEKASRTSIRFVSTRIRETGHISRVAPLLDAAPRMPHAADSLSRLFKDTMPPNVLQDWYLDYARGSWASHKWAVAQYGRSFPSSRPVRRPLRSFFAEAIRDANTTLPLLAVASQRLSVWDPVEARSAFRDAATSVASAHARRVVALSALNAGEGRTHVRRWLGVDPENHVTLEMLDRRGYGRMTATSDFAD